VAEDARVIALYRTPDDVEAFEKRYFEDHLKLIEQFPDVRRIVVNRVLGDDAPYYLMTEMCWDTVEAMRQSLQSQEGAAAIGDIQEFAAGQYIVLQVETVDTRQFGT
jgi:uncharacterized protein (TIGR02118 family)